MLYLKRSQFNIFFIIIRCRFLDYRTSTIMYNLGVHFVKCYSNEVIMQYKENEIHFVK